MSLRKLRNTIQRKLRTVFSDNIVNRMILAVQQDEIVLSESRGVQDHHAHWKSTLWQDTVGHTDRNGKL